MPLRVKAVHAFGELPEAPALAAANKRIGNILKKENRLGDAGVRTLEPQEITVDLLSAGAERDLYDTLQSIAPICAAHWGRQDYAQALVALAALKTPTDTFFDQVMVNDPNEQLRNNRLALLQNLHLEMNRVADLARLAA